MCFCLVFFNIMFRFNNNNNLYLYSVFEGLYKVALQETEIYHKYEFIYFISRW